MLHGKYAIKYICVLYSTKDQHGITPFDILMEK